MSHGPPRGRAWIPHPVPRSNAASIGRRTVAPANATVDALIPSTCAGSAVPGADGHVVDDEVVGVVAERPDRDQPAAPSSSTATSPPATHAAIGSGASAAMASRIGTGVPTGTAGTSTSSRSPDAARPHERCRLAGSEVREHVRAEPLGDRAERVAGVVERLPGPANGVGGVEEPHRRHRDAFRARCRNDVRISPSIRLQICNRMLGEISSGGGGQVGVSSISETAGIGRSNSRRTRTVVRPEVAGRFVLGELGRRRRARATRRRPATAGRRPSLPTPG